MGYCSQDSDMLPAGHVIFALLSASGTAQREGLGGGGREGRRRKKEEIVLRALILYTP